MNVSGISNNQSPAFSGIHFRAKALYAQYGETVLDNIKKDTNLLQLAQKKNKDIIFDAKKINYSNFYECVDFFCIIKEKGFFAAIKKFLGKRNQKEYIGTYMSNYDSPETYFSHFVNNEERIDKINSGAHQWNKNLKTMEELENITSKK